MPTDDAFARLLATLDLAETGARTTEDIFTGPSEPMPHGRVYGGQVLAQTVVAAQRTVDGDRPIHSLHGYFLRPGDVRQPITFGVDRIHDGRSFSTRRVQAYQSGLPIFSMIASFQVPAEGLDHQEPIPEGIPAPEALPTMDEFIGDGDTPEQQFAKAWSSNRAFEIRHVDEPVYFESSERPRSPRQAAWVRAAGTLPDSDALHRAALGYVSDYLLIEPGLRAHGLSWSHSGLKAASLDHAIWWHRSARADDWLLYTQESPSASGGRALSTGRLYTREGLLVATVAQEGMVRIPEVGRDDSA